MPGIICSPAHFLMHSYKQGGVSRNKEIKLDKPLTDFPSPCFPPAAPGRSPPAQEIKASGALVPAWPRQDRLVVPVAFPGRQPDGSNESAASGLVKGIPPL